MEFFRIKKDIPFMQHALIFNVISLLTFVAAVAFIALRGLHFSIEFTGGTVIEVAYDHPLLEAILKDTYGCMVFQEQVMEISKKLAGFTPGEADGLRKAMGKKVPEEIEKLQAEVARRLGYKLVDHRLELYAVPLDDKARS